MKPPPLDIKRRRQSSFPNIEEALSLWVENAVSDKVTLTDSILREKARKFAVLFNNREFGAANGWLEGFKKRNNLKSYKKRGEAGSVDVAKLPEQREHLKSILEGYNECDIFNCDKTALFWKMEPRTTLARASVSGKKLLKDRVSILTTCNATGEERLYCS